MRTATLRFMIVLIWGCMTLHAGHAEAQNHPSPGTVRQANARDDTAAPDISAILAIEDKEKRSAGLQKAIEYYEHFLGTHSDNIPALQQLGNLYAWMNKYDLAISTYQTAIRKDKDNTALKNSLARIYRWAQRFPDAEILYKSVLASAPDSKEALKGLAVTYLKEGDYPNAKNILDRALYIYPKEAELYKEQGVLLAWQERYSEAATSLKKAIELSPDMADAFVTLGDVYYWNKQYQHALDEYRHALTLVPDSPDLPLMVAKAYRGLNNLILAEEYANNALRLNPVSAEAKALLGAIHRDQHLINWEYGVHYLEFVSLLFVVILIAFGCWKNRRMMKRLHPVLSRSIPIILPIIVLLSVAALVFETVMKNLFDIEFFESVASSLVLILLGIVYLAQILHAGRNNNRSQNKVILAIGAHPDDIELGCGGYILKAKAEGARVYGLTLTKGERGTEAVNVREMEARNAASFMELDDYWVLDFADTHVQDSIGEVKEKIEEIIKRVEPTVVLVHNPHDPHADHRAAFAATKEAARQVPALLCYESVGTPAEYRPDHFIDITDHLAETLHLIDFHKSQKNKSYMDHELLKGRAAHRGIQAGVPYAMAFQSYRIVN